MSLRRQIASGSLKLMLGEGVGHAASFVRYMILARVLTRADFAIAAALGMVMVLFEFAAKMGISRFIVRDRDGDDPDFMASAHTVQGSAGALGACAVALAAVPLAALFGIPHHAWAFLALGGIFLLHGLQHLDISRYQRAFRFGPYVWMESIPQMLILLATWPVAVWLGDYRAVLVLLLAKALIACAISHLLAERAFRFGWSHAYVTRMVRFGWPLMVSGLLLFAVTHGEKFLVATYYSMEDLAPYAAAVSLVLVPGFMFTQILRPVALPFLARVQDDPTALIRRHRQVMAVVTLFSAVYVVAIIVAAGPIMRIAFGPKYADAGVLLAWLAAAAAFRHLRVATVLTALARGDAHNQMWSNVFRVLSLGPAAAVAAAQQPLWMIACMGLLGEALACAVSFRRLARRDGVPMSASLAPAGWLILLATSASMVYPWGIEAWKAPWALCAAAVGGLIAAGLTAMRFPELQIEITRIARCMPSDAWRTMGLRRPADQPGVS